MSKPDDVLVAETVIAKRDEYLSIFSAVKDPDNPDELAQVLQDDGDWSERGADALIEVAHEYGYWFLENALAVALALEIPEGSKGI